MRNRGLRDGTDPLDQLLTIVGKEQLDHFDPLKIIQYPVQRDPIDLVAKLLIQIL